MSRPPALPPEAPPLILQPCSEACAAFRPLRPGEWSEFGLCSHPRSPRRGYPVRLGRDCAFYTVTPADRIIRAN